jgi:RNA polymerase sporulation-specific sigma factor
MKHNLEQIVAEHTGLVKSVALRLSYIYGEDVEDLIQIGYIGLIKAAKGFEAERGLKFSTYAVPMIAGEIKMQLRDHGYIKMSRSLKSEIWSMKKAEQELTLTLGRSPKISELAKKINVTEEHMSEIMQAADATKNFESFEDVDISLTEEEFNVQKIDIMQSIDELEAMEKQILVLRYYKDMTQKQVSKTVGISQAQVCRIEKIAKEKMFFKLKI